MNLEQWEQLDYISTFTSTVESNGIYPVYDLWEKINLSTNTANGEIFFSFTDSIGNYKETALVWFMPIILLWSDEEYKKNRDHTIDQVKTAYIKLHEIMRVRISNYMINE